MRYIKQRYVDLSKPQTSQNNSEQIKQSVVVLNPEKSTFVAVHRFKQAQDHVQEVKRRISVLKIQEEKNIKRIKDNQRKMQMHEIVQNGAQRQKLRLKKFIENMNRSIQQQRQSNEKERKNRHQSIKLAKEIIQSQRSMDFHLSRQKSLEIQKSIKQFRNQNLLINKAKRDEIVDMQNSIRENLKKSAIKKTAETANSKSKDACILQTKKQQKQAQLLQLTKLQAEMIQRQSKSRMVCDESQKRLRFVRKQSRNTVRSGKDRETTSDKTESILPSIHKRTKTNGTQIVLI